MTESQYLSSLFTYDESAPYYFINNKTGLPMQVRSLVRYKSQDGKYTTITRKRLAWILLYGDIDKKTYVYLIDGNKDNLSPTNLAVRASTKGTFDQFKKNGSSNIYYHKQSKKFQVQFQFEKKLTTAYFDTFPEAADFIKSHY